jgi:hypothetical protein
VTAEQWHEHLVKLAMHAYDVAYGPHQLDEHGVGLLDRPRAAFTVAVRERMAQAAQVIAAQEVVTCEGVREHVSACAYCGGDR